MQVRDEIEPFSLNSKLYQAESIEIEQCQITDPVVLSHFQGRQAFIRCRFFENFDLIEFVKKWKSGEAFQKLEYLEIRILYFVLFDKGILNEFAAKYICATKNPPTHVLPRIFIGNGFERNTHPITSHTYVVRESDGHVASVQIQGKKFKFGVWNQTEEEFLNMVE
ncbi:hypothetical protein B9Z55_000622 [Caenorhabditis nigoni]|uniref:F-box associated domain-containing protein n=1 Tax=Caenorhabditis nigoni TaxID=1611254 RepID=A0A2G5VU23_9PELO|nr:hypothetical protein B9Z55_000622 [Caenorhabditis nigoni]